MCGIAGIFNFNKPVKNIELKKMRDAAPWRGPHSSGIWYDNNIGFLIIDFLFLIFQAMEINLCTQNLAIQ